jgi:hypothetical protein
METWSMRRLGPVAGVLFIAFNVVGDAIAGSPPETSDSALKIAHFFVENHSEVVAGAVFTSIAAPLWLVLLAALALLLRQAGLTPAAITVFALGIAGVTLGAASDALFGTLGRIAPTTSPQTVKSLYQLDGFLVARSFWFAAAITLLIAWYARASLPRWYAVLNLVAAVLLAIGGLSLKTTGFFEPLGGMTLIAFLALLVWTLATSWIIWSTTPDERTA